MKKLLFLFTFITLVMIRPMEVKGTDRCQETSRPGASFTNPKQDGCTTEFKLRYPECDYDPIECSRDYSYEFSGGEKVKYDQNSNTLIVEHGEKGIISITTTTTIKCNKDLIASNPPGIIKNLYLKAIVAENECRSYSYSSDYQINTSVKHIADCNSSNPNEVGCESKIEYRKCETCKEWNPVNIKWPGDGNILTSCKINCCGKQFDETIPIKTCETIEKACKEEFNSEIEQAKCIIDENANCCNKINGYDEYHSTYTNWNDFLNGLGFNEEKKEEIYKTCPLPECKLEEEEKGVCCEYFMQKENPEGVLGNHPECCINYKNGKNLEEWKEFVKKYQSQIKVAVDKGYEECSDCDIEINTEGNISDEEGNTVSNNMGELISSCKLNGQVVGNTITNIIEETIGNSDEDCIFTPEAAYPKGEENVNLGSVKISNEIHSYCKITCTDKLEYTYPTAFSVATGHRFIIGSKNKEDGAVNTGAITFKLSKSCSITNKNEQAYNEDVKNYSELKNKIDAAWEICEKGVNIDNTELTPPTLEFDYSSGISVPLEAHITEQINNSNNLSITWSYELLDNYNDRIDKKTGESYSSSRAEEYKGPFYSISSSIPISYSETIGNKEYSIKITEKGSIKESFFTKMQEVNNGTYDCSYRVTKGLDVVYRPISLKNPFPGLNGGGRETGINWCDSERNDCGNDNQIVEYYIKNNREVSGEEIYKLEPLYEINLTPALIKEIREYNDSHPYDDFELNCENGIKCKSDFVCKYLSGTKAQERCNNS